MATTRPERIASALRLTIAANPLWIDASGNSMGRAIVPGSEVLVGPARRPRIGQVWAFCDDGGSVVVHRCRGRRTGQFLFEGDATGRADPPVDPNRLIGRVRAVRTQGRVRHLGPADAAIGAAATWVRRLIRLIRRPGGR